MQSRREGMALAMVLLLVLLMGSIAAAAATISSNSWVMTQYKERQGTLSAVADAGVEEGRARVNGDRTIIRRVPAVVTWPWKVAPVE